MLSLGFLVSLTLARFARSQTWNWNRYPGARVDILSADYSFKFDADLYKDWNWKEIYGTLFPLVPRSQMLTFGSVQPPSPSS